MKKSLFPTLCFVLSTMAFAQQPPVPDVFVKGDFSLLFNTRRNIDSSGNVKEGVTDKYTMAINVANSAQFTGTIEHTPYIGGMVGESQQSKLDYLINCAIFNPKNPSQKRDVGRIFGSVPVDRNNNYRFDEGTLKLVTFAAGTAKGFESAFRGLALGKPPTSSEGFMSKLKKEALQVSKSINGKNVSIAVTKYDKMEFKSHVLAAGPVQIYPESSVNGTMIYDYGRTAWYFDNFTVSYNIDGRQYQDKITGNIRWIEASNRSATGEGEYQFDIRINEPAQAESAVFSGPADESAFFSTDDSLMALTGAMKYKDSMMGDRVVASVVSLDLRGNKITKQQAMYLSKLLFLSSVVPLNAE